MKVIRGKFGFDKDLKPAFFVSCKLDNVDEKDGHFPLTFAIVTIEQKKMLTAVQGETNIGQNTFKKEQIIAIANPIIAVFWLKSLIEEKKYRCVLTYYSDIEKIDNQVDAFMVPFTAEHFTEIPDVPGYEEMLKLLQS